MPRLILFRVMVIVLAIAGLSPATAGAQDADTRAPAVIEAASLRDSGKLAEAVEVLRAHRAVYPDDGDAIRLLSQMLYWLQDFQGARALYDSAVVLHPEDATLRLQYARMLMETGDAPHAREIISPLVAGASPDPRAISLLGTMAYWEGDFTTAQRLFREALAADSTDEDARRQLAGIRAVAAPWIRVAAGGLHDDQPLDRWGGSLEAGYFLTPLFSVKARAGSDRYSESAQTGTTSSASVTTVSGALGVDGVFPSSHADLSLAGGFIQRSDPSDVDWTGAAALGMRPSSFTRLEVRAERSAYLYTVSSLRVPVMTDEFGGSFDVDRKGWTGRAAYAFQKFPDDNSGTSAYAWAMAPIARGTGVLLQGGYSASYQDSRELRFVESSTGGDYDPYYTPQNVLSHSVIVAFTSRDGNGLVARLGGSYGVQATEDAPVFVQTPGGPPGALVVQSRSFHPWTARAVIDRRLSGGGSISARVEHFRTAFYNATSGSVELTWRLAPR